MGKFRITSIAILTSLGFLCTSCMTGVAEDMSALLQPFPEASVVEEVAVIDDVTPDDTMTQENAYLDTLREAHLVGPELEAILLELGYTPPVEEPVPQEEALLEQETEAMAEEVLTEEVPMETAEVVTGTTEDVPQKKDGISVIMDGEIPDGMTIIFCILFLATLFALCYIAKQRKEARWHMFRD